MKIILLNGPPGSGKDFATRALMMHFSQTHPVCWERFSLPNKYAFAAMVRAGVTNTLDSKQGPGIVDYYEAHKEEIIPWLGVSYRQWQIDFSEKFMKPLYGQDIHAKLFLHRQYVHIDAPGYLCFVSDCGFQIEYDVVEKAKPDDDVLLIRLHREGKSFAGDSREWVHGLQDRSIDNPGDDIFAPHIIKVVEDWLRGHS